LHGVHEIPTVHSTQDYIVSIKQHNENNIDIYVMYTKEHTWEPIKIGVVTSKTRTFSSKRFAIATGKSGWHSTPPAITWPPSIPCRLTATLSPALASVQAWESRSKERTDPTFPDGITRTYNFTNITVMAIILGKYVMPYVTRLLSTKTSNLYHRHTKHASESQTVHAWTVVQSCGSLLSRWKKKIGLPI